MLDLFNQRMEVYELILSGIRPILRDGRASDGEIFSVLHEAKAKSQFLFGNEINGYISEIISLAASSASAASQYDDGVGDHKKHAEDMYKCNIACMEAIDQLPLLFAPYMKMDQRLPDTQPHSAPSLATVLERRPQKGG